MDEPDDKHPYKSRFGAGYVTAAQFLAEGIIDRKARKGGVSLPARFWQLDKYKREFALQVRHALGLLKIYPAEAIIAALRTKEGGNAWSLGARWLDAIIRSEAERLKARGATAAAPPPAQPPPQAAEPQAPRPAFVPKKSLADKLKGL